MNLSNKTIGYTFRHEVKFQFHLHSVTGTTWTQEMVWCIANNVDLMAAEKLLLKRFPFLEYLNFVQALYLNKKCFV